MPLPPALVGAGPSDRRPAVVPAVMSHVSARRVLRYVLGRGYVEEAA